MAIHRAGANARRLPVWPSGRCGWRLRVGRATWFRRRLAPRLPIGRIRRRWVGWGARPGAPIISPGDSRANRSLLWLARWTIGRRGARGLACLRAWRLLWLLWLLWLTLPAMRTLPRPSAPIAAVLRRAAVRLPSARWRG